MGLVFPGFHFFDQSQKIWIFCDPRHLLKDAGNGLCSSRLSAARQGKSAHNVCYLQGSRPYGKRSLSCGKHTKRPHVSTMPIEHKANFRMPKFIELQAPRPSTTGRQLRMRGTKQQDREAVVRNITDHINFLEDWDKEVRERFRYDECKRTESFMHTKRTGRNSC